jgi:hypothetical protein
LAVRYADKLDQTELKPLCLFHLAVVVVLMAAKLEEHIRPTFKKMIDTVKEEFDFSA